ncbi:hypothetical protein CB1_000436014 [Camelus ferus]|nr:hypothetical protein CB1_000436014 [Camelus ferus]
MRYLLVSSPGANLKQVIRTKVPPRPELLLLAGIAAPQAIHHPLFGPGSLFRMPTPALGGGPEDRLFVQRVGPVDTRWGRGWCAGQQRRSPIRKSRVTFKIRQVKTDASPGMMWLGKHLVVIFEKLPWSDHLFKAVP